MARNPLPLLIEPEELQGRLEEAKLLIVDVGRPSVYSRFHLPGALFLDYRQLVAARGQVGGLLPNEGQLGEALSAIGFTPERHVVAYDEEGGGKAARLLWTLEILGHRDYSLLNGGLHAWANEGRPLTDRPTAPSPSRYRASLPADSPVVASRAYIQAHLDDPKVVLLDARSLEEFRGQKRFSERGGHIPGAVNLEWTQTMDQGRNLRLRPAEELRELLESAGITPDKTVVVYCQTHHRSAHTFLMLRTLGYPDVRGYPGSWSDWGNRDDTPVAHDGLAITPGG